MKLRFNTTVVFTLLFATLLGSCGKKMYLLQEQKTSSNSSDDIEVSPQPKLSDHIIQTGDVLGITIYLPIPVSSIDNKESNSGTSDKLANTFTVKEDSTIFYPPIGIINVGKKNLADIESIIIDSLSKNYNNPRVLVTLEGFRVSVVGEVNSPGIITIPAGTATIVEVISAASGLSQYANPKTIKVVRDSVEGKTSHTIDLTDIDVFKDPYYRIRSNDIIYVRDVPRKYLRENIILLSTGITLINTVAIFTIRLNQN